MHGDFAFLRPSPFASVTNLRTARNASAQFAGFRAGAHFANCRRPATGSHLLNAGEIRYRLCPRCSCGYVHVDDGVTGRTGTEPGR
jgi:hypothetical protein